MENERLDLVLQNIESATSDMKSMYEARLNGKDKTIERTEFKTIFMMLISTDFQVCVLQTFHYR
jgi:hypothetical protein